MEEPYYSCMPVQSMGSQTCLSCPTDGTLE